MRKRWTQILVKIQAFCSVFSLMCINCFRQKEKNYYRGRFLGKNDLMKFKLAGEELHISDFFQREFESLFQHWPIIIACHGEYIELYLSIVKNLFYKYIELERVSQLTKKKCSMNFFITFGLLLAQQLYNTKNDTLFYTSVAAVLSWSLFIKNHNYFFRLVPPFHICHI